MVLACLRGMRAREVFRNSWVSGLCKWMGEGWLYLPRQRPQEEELAWGSCRTSTQLTCPENSVLSSVEELLIQSSDFGLDFPSGKPTSPGCNRCWLSDQGLHSEIHFCGMLEVKTKGACLWGLGAGRMESYRCFYLWRCFLPTEKAGVQ